MEKITYFLFLLSIVSGYAQETSSHFDWSGYEKWENKTVYSKTYVVDQKHQHASDTNEGTLQKPLKTINRAAELVKAGERVVVYGGVYRETIFPINGGESNSKMISYEAAPGEEVIVKGSKILSAKWEQRKIYTDVIKDTTLSYTWSRKIWVTTIPDTFFEDGYFPLKLPNILPQEHKLMPWAKLVKNISPYTSTRGLIFQDGKRMVQLEDYGDLTRVPGSFWVDADGKTIHIHSFDSGNPNSSLFEVAIRSHLFKPKQVGLNYIQVRGFTFEHCANGFLRTSTGAVTTLGGQRWIIEDNTIRHVNSSGLEFGYMAYETEDPNTENFVRERKDDMGFMLVRNNHIYDCGTAGIRSFVVSNGIIENNHIHHIGWQDAENYWECSGIKMLVTHKTLVSNNHIHDIQGGNGIWLDWDIRYSRVTQNVIYDVQNIQGGIFVEASHYPNLVDNNFVWNIDGNGIYANDTDYLMVYHNMVGNTTGSVVHAIVQTDRFQNGRKLTAEENRVFNNVFVDTRPMRFSANSNLVDHNVYIKTKQPDYIDLKELRAKGHDENSIQINGQVALNREALYVFWKSTDVIEKVPRLPEVSFDLFNNPRTAEVLPGPFNFLNKTIIPLKEH
ncbi:right-handed parallel beta-helix repeat-containing protein [Allomuricauda sp. SCSIO 65647]|uniref:right-handed parallel beta-helix repeat-containing protein n=1 Tax=Allomuricauda sp. SCSIO 65647 TaxID=2908843 RepID=UPI001F48CDD0|nr:right-handed parallel beta-helix repeat-containing protein [Muricauda sp. SCSIO 65647]UJH68518.1 right-handed parallel beta-helix repeat-containing protein [Muricauda sp. SCSIO 65647]